MTLPDPVLDAHEIRPGLWLGSMEAACNHGELLKRGITHILTLGEQLPTWMGIEGAGSEESWPNRRIRLAATCRDPFERMLVALLDCPEEQISKHWPACTAFISESLANPKNSLLVHCFAGVSRGSSTVAQYLMRAEGLTAYDALCDIARKRTFINPNEGFVAQLKELEVELVRVDGRRTSDARHRLAHQQSPFAPFLAEGSDIAAACHTRSQGFEDDTRCRGHVNSYDLGNADKATVGTWTLTGSRETSSGTLTGLGHDDFMKEVRKGFAVSALEVQQHEQAMVESLTPFYSLQVHAPADNVPMLSSHGHSLQGGLRPASPLRASFAERLDGLRHPKQEPQHGADAPLAKKLEASLGHLDLGPATFLAERLEETSAARSPARSPTPPRQHSTLVDDMRVALSPCSRASPRSVSQPRTSPRRYHDDVSAYSPMFATRGRSHQYLTEPLALSPSQGMRAVLATRSVRPTGTQENSFGRNRSCEFLAADPLAESPAWLAALSPSHSSFRAVSPSQHRGTQPSPAPPRMSSEPDFSKDHSAKRLTPRRSALQDQLDSISKPACDLGRSHWTMGGASGIWSAGSLRGSAHSSECLFRRGRPDNPTLFAHPSQICA